MLNETVERTHLKPIKKMQRYPSKTREALARTAFILLAGTSLMAQNSPQSTASEASHVQKAKSPPLLTAELKAGLGYKDNVLESENNREGAAFALGQFNLALKPEEIPLSLRVMGEERRFVDSQLLREEQAFEAEGVYSPVAPDQWHTTLTGLYHFDNGVEDVSDEQVGVSSAKVKGHEFTGMAEVERELGDSVTVSLEPFITRQTWSAILDDYLQYGATLRTEWESTDATKFSLRYQARNRDYDNRTQADALGNSLVGSSLTYLNQDVTAQCRHYWDEAHRWQTRLRLGTAWNTDNGSGYYDYQRYQVSSQLRYSGKEWQFDFGYRYNFTDYSSQPANGTQGTTYHRSGGAVTSAVAWNFREDWNLSLEYEWERVDSNRAADDYTVNTVSLGLSYAF